MKRITNKQIAEIIRLVEKLTDYGNYYHVVVWRDGKAAIHHTTDIAARPTGNGWEYPLVTLTKPMPKERIRWAVDDAQEAIRLMEK